MRTGAISETKGRLPVDEDYRSVFAHRAREGERKAGQQRGRQHGNHNAADGLEAIGAERRGCLFEAAVDLADDRLYRSDRERQGDEDERNENPERRECYFDVKTGEHAADPTVRRIQGRQRDPGDGGRQGERQIDGGVQQPAARKAVACKDPGDQQSEGAVGDSRRQREPEARTQRGHHPRLARHLPNPAQPEPGRLRDQRG